MFLISLVSAKIRAHLPFADSDEGQAMIEYSLIMALVVIVVLITLIVLGNTVRNTYCNIEGAVSKGGM
jgi:Flp pilus assembly pilin Flp